MKQTISIWALLVGVGFGALPAQAQLKRTDENPPAQVVTSGDYLTGCTAEQQTSVTEAAGHASTLLQRRINDLKAELKPMETTGASPSEIMQSALKKHFHIPPKMGDHKKVMQHLVHLYEGMYYNLIDVQRWPKISCVDEHKKCEAGTNAYTFAIPGASSHLCPDFFKSKNLLLRADTVIHEMAHRHVPTSETDFNETGYYKSTNESPLGMSDSLKNSDSYSHFVTDVPSGKGKKKP